MGQRLNFADVGFRHLGHVQTEEVLDLQGCDDDGDTTGEAQGHRRRNVLDEASEPGHPHGYQKEARIRVAINRPPTPNCWATG